MSQKEQISIELKGLNSGLPSQLPDTYSVPEGYFEGLPQRMLSRIKALEAGSVAEELAHLSPYLSTVSRKLPFEVPAGYFEELDPGFVMVDDVDALSPMLKNLQKNIPYSVPDGYFESIERPVVKNEPAKLIPFTKRRWLKYAAAAVVAGLILLAGFYFSDKKEPGMKAIAKLTRDVKKMDESQKDQLLDFIDAGLSGTESVSANDKSTIENLLKGIPEEELNDFTEQTEDIEDLLMIN